MEAEYPFRLFTVAAHRIHECLRGIEFFFATDEFHEFQVEFLAVNILVEIQDVYFYAPVLTAEGGAVTDIDQCMVAFVFQRCIYGVDPVAGDELSFVVGVQVGRRESQSPSDLVAFDHKSRETVAVPEQLGCARDISLQEAVADLGGADRDITYHLCGDLLQQDVIFLCDLLHHPNIAPAFLAELMVVPDDDHFRMKIADQEFADIFAGIHFRKLT